MAINWQTENTGHATNKISTTKYNIFTIVPITIFLQFTYVPNVLYALGGVL